MAARSAPDVTEADAGARLVVGGVGFDLYVGALGVQRYPALVPPLQKLGPLQHPPPRPQGTETGGGQISVVAVGVPDEVIGPARESLHAGGQRGRVRWRKGFLRLDDFVLHVRHRRGESHGEHLNVGFEARVGTPFLNVCFFARETPTPDRTGRKSQFLASDWLTRDDGGPPSTMSCHASKG